LKYSKLLEKWDEVMDSYPFIWPCQVVKQKIQHYVRHIILNRVRDKLTTVHLQPNFEHFFPSLLVHQLFMIY